MKRNGLTPVVLALGLLTLTACGTTTAPKAAVTSPVTAKPVTVFAAASLKEALTEIGAAYERTHPGAKVTLSFAGSQALVAQVQQGAPADLLATADTASAQSVAKELAGAAQVIARNQLAIITAPGNPLKIARLADLAKRSVKVVLAGPTVPAGKAARKALSAAGVTVKEVSDEPDVRAVVAKVRLGEADAGIAYATDVQASKGAVAGVTLPGISNSYPAAVLSGAAHAATARDLLAFLLSPDGQAILASYGFLPPT